MLLPRILPMQSLIHTYRSAPATTTTEAPTTTISPTTTTTTTTAAPPSFFVRLRHAPARVEIFLRVALIRALDDCVGLQGRSDVTAAELHRDRLPSHGDCASECSPGTCLFSS